MQSFIVLASLVSEVAGGGGGGGGVEILSPQRYKKHLSPLSVSPSCMKGGVENPERFFEHNSA